MNRNIPTEYLLNNFIDKDLQKILLPLNVFQALFLVSRYTISNNFITPKNVTSHIKSAIGAIILMFSHWLRFFYYKYALVSFGSPIIEFLFYFDLVAYSVIAALIHIVSGLQTCDACDLVIKLQQIINSIKISDRSFFFNVKVNNWISVFSLVFIYTGFLFAGLIQSEILTGWLSSILLTYSTMIYDLHIVELSCLVYLLTKQLELWNQTMEDCWKINNDGVEIRSKVMLKMYKDILKAFNLCNKVFQFSITHSGVQCFTYILVDLQMLFEFEKTEGEAVDKSLKARLIIFSWNLKNIALLIALSITCEGFYKAVDAAKYICARLLVNCQCKDLRKTCKNVPRLNRAVFRKMSAFGIFEFDAAFPLRLLSCLVPYIVVLLQFALQ